MASSSDSLSPKPLIALLLVLVLAFVFFGITWGPVTISLNDWWLILTNNPQHSPLLSAILFESRLPRIINALIAGAALATAGLLMQTIFRNPLAGPSVLGISGGSSLAAALLLLGGGSAITGWLGTLSLAAAAAIGAIALLSLVLVVANRFRDQNSILLIGLMLGYLTSAIESVLQFSSSGEALKAYAIWGMGSFGHALWPQIALMSVVVLMVLVVIYPMRTALNIYLLGDEQAKSLGLTVHQFRKKTIVLTGLLVAVVTAFCGPIGFIGLISPHLVRMVLKTASHSTLLTATLLTGSVLALAADLAVRWLNVPLNAITALIGAPVVLLVILRRAQR